MRNRLLLWSAAGFLVSLLWFICAVNSAVPLTVSNRMVWELAQLTQPVILTNSFTHSGLKFYWVFLGNALTYGLIGLLFETIRGRVAPMRRA